MFSRDSNTRLTIIIYVFLVTFVRPAWSQASQSHETSQPSQRIRVDARIEMLANGDARGTIVLDFDDQAYAAIRDASPDPSVFLRAYRHERADELFDDDAATSVYDDQDTAVVLSLHRYGAARNEGGGRWTLDLEDEYQFINCWPGDDGRQVVFSAVQAEGPGMVFDGQATHTLPEGAGDVSFDQARRVLSWTTPEPAEEGRGRLAVEFDARDRLMSGLYKTYGLGTDFADQWVAKTVFRNTGNGTVRDLRVRYRVAGYSDWSTWQKYPEIVPGQTVVSVHYPVLDHSLATLRTTTPADVQVEWRYRDGDDVISEDDGERIALLGARDFVFSDLTGGEARNWFDANLNAPLLAAWVMRDDAVVSAFAALANKLSGGDGACFSDDEALNVLRACYQLMVANDFTYQGPVGMIDRGLGYDVQMVQRIKYPRDVIQDKSGTCVELACLYASMAHAVGLKPFVVVVPGHAFPVVELPSGKLLAIETTGIRGGIRPTALSFDETVEIGRQVLETGQQSGELIIVDVYRMWGGGIANPELPALPHDVLHQWSVAAHINTPRPEPTLPSTGAWTPPTTPRG